MSTEYGDPAIEWNEANAANADGQAFIDGEREAERLHLEQMATVTRQWLQALGDARTAVVKAQTLQAQLANLDYDFDESSLDNAARLNLNDAWRSLDGVTTIANGLLKPIVDAEKDAEIGQLRARNEELERLLASRDLLPAPVAHYCETGNCHLCGDSDGAVDGEGSESD